MRRTTIAVAAFSFLVGFTLNGLIRLWPIQPTATAAPLFQEQKTNHHKSRVLKIMDGDTIVMSYQSSVPMKEKVRLLNVNTPERGEPGFRQAAQALKKLVANKTVRLEFETPNLPKRDRYGRLLAYVMADGLNVNVELVRQGWSTYWTKYGQSRFRQHFIQAQRQARTAKRGVWDPRGIQ